MTLFTLLFVGAAAAGTDRRDRRNTQPTGGSTGGASRGLYSGDSPIWCLQRSSATRTRLSRSRIVLCVRRRLFAPLSCTKLTRFACERRLLHDRHPVVDPLYQKWGCGLGMELNDIGERRASTAPGQVLRLDLIGSSGGNEVRINFTQARTQPYGFAVRVGRRVHQWMGGRVCFTERPVPTWAATKVAQGRGRPWHAIESADPGFCGRRRRRSARSTYGEQDIAGDRP